MPASLRRASALIESVTSDVDVWAKHKHSPAPADGLTGKQHARAHLAAMSPERRDELNAEWDA